MSEYGTSKSSGAQSVVFSLDFGLGIDLLKQDNASLLQQPCLQQSCVSAGHVYLFSVFLVTVKLAIDIEWLEPLQITSTLFIFDFRNWSSKKTCVHMRT